MPGFVKLTLSVLVLVVLAAGGRVYLARESTQRESGAGPAPAATAMAATPVMMAPITVITVPRVGIARVMVDAVGGLLADEAVVLRRPEIDGRIQSLAFTEGQAVARGDAFIALDPAEYEADVAQKEVSVDLWQLKFSRARDLMGRKVMSKQDYDEAEASLKVAKVALALARARLAKTSLRAPFAGILGLRRVSPRRLRRGGKSVGEPGGDRPHQGGPPVPRTPRLPSVRVRPSPVDAFPVREYTG